MVGEILAFFVGAAAGLVWGWWIWSGAPLRRDQDARVALEEIGMAYLNRHTFAALTIYKDGRIQVWDDQDLADKQKSGSAT